jgi:hypothetical protein
VRDAGQRSCAGWAPAPTSTTRSRFMSPARKRAYGRVFYHAGASSCVTR